MDDLNIKCSESIDSINMLGKLAKLSNSQTNIGGSSLILGVWVSSMSSVLFIHGKGVLLISTLSFVTEGLYLFAVTNMGFFFMFISFWRIKNAFFIFYFYFRGMKLFLSVFNDESKTSLDALFVRFDDVLFWFWVEGIIVDFFILSLKFIFDFDESIMLMRR